MSENRPTKKDFVDLINTVMGQQIMTEDQLTQFLNEAKKMHDTRGTEGLIEYIQRVTNAPGSKDQLKNLAETIKNSGNPSDAINYLQKEKLISEDQMKKLHKSMDRTPRKRRKK